MIESFYYICVYTLIDILIFKIYHVFSQTFFLSFLSVLPTRLFSRSKCYYKKITFLFTYFFKNNSLFWELVKTSVDSYHLFFQNRFCLSNEIQKKIKKGRNNSILIVFSCIKIHMLHYETIYTCHTLLC